MTKVFDCNCMLGRFANPQLKYFPDAESLIEEMNYFGISESLVYHSLAKEYDPATGNQVLLEEIKGYENLYPCWVLLPTATGEIEKPKKLLQLMSKNRVKAVRLYPDINYHRYSLDDWCIGEILGLLNDIRMPLLIELEQIAWSNVYNICSRYTKLPLVITKATYRIDRDLYPLLKRFRNLHVEISGYQLYRGIETICNKFGARHLLFGTNMPIFTAGSSLTMVTYARISEENRELISGGNLRRLISEIRY